ncbi:hypothetical protein CONLIGDRAFT_687615 [Coniochaeta ligniaria NRRL 30616]|uniref:Ankyrin n=1 Tax=Coniochaeta ligniaria NRRL 30616 TaxID=1408157 RepID=A0A1J7I4E0_9PEZI|nr:hypothetical protein CONLIGDRAFT_687615 [Coniochaeta ligniaria NRRL 30616]
MEQTFPSTHPAPTNDAIAAAAANNHKALETAPAMIGRTPLSYACEAGSVLAVEALLAWNNADATTPPEVEA